MVTLVESSTTLRAVLQTWFENSFFDWFLQYSFLEKLYTALLGWYKGREVTWKVDLSDLPTINTLLVTVKKNIFQLLS